MNPISGRLWWLVTEDVESLDMQMRTEGVEVHCG